MKEAALSALSVEFPDLVNEIDIETVCLCETNVRQRHTSYGILLVAECESGSLLAGSAASDRSSSFESVGSAAGESLARELRQGGCFDEHMQDQLLVFMALADGESRIRVNEISLHTKTSMWICSELTGAAFSVSPDGECNSIISCKGIGGGKGW